MTERIHAPWGNPSCAVVAALACVSASLVSCPQVGMRSVCKVGVAITAPLQLPGRMPVSLEDDDREFQEDELSTSGLPGVRLDLPPSLTLAQITPPPSVYLSRLNLAHHALRC